MKKVKLIWNHYDKEQIIKIDAIQEQENNCMLLFLENKIVAEYNKLLVTLVIIQD